MGNTCRKTRNSGSSSQIIVKLQSTDLEYKDTQSLHALEKALERSSYFKDLEVLDYLNFYYINKKTGLRLRISDEKSFKEALKCTGENNLEIQISKKSYNKLFCLELTELGNPNSKQMVRSLTYNLGTFQNCLTEFFTEFRRLNNFSMKFKDSNSILTWLLLGIAADTAEFPVSSKLKLLDKRPYLVLNLDKLSCEGRKLADYWIYFMEKLELTYTELQKIMHQLNTVSQEINSLNLDRDRELSIKVKNLKNISKATQVCKSLHKKLNRIEEEIKNTTFTYQKENLIGTLSLLSEIASFSQLKYLHEVKLLFGLTNNPV